MVISDNFELTRTADKSQYTLKYVDKTGTIDKEYSAPLYEALEALYEACEGKTRDECGSIFATMTGAKQCEEIFAVINDMKSGVEVCPKRALEGDERLLRGLSRMIEFFTEFDFEPNFRFVNSVALQPSLSAKKQYIVNYFRLLDNAYANDVEHKMRSQEFAKIMEDIDSAKPTSRINNRLKVYYGSAGTGKTTLAQKESGGRCIVCNNSMFPSDIMEDFVFVDGQPSFDPSIFWECMEKGEKIVLDEINLLPFDTLRFLQGLLDGKKSFNYKGRTVNIKDGFEVIGTMNLNIGGTVFGLPEPLVDRCYDFKEFKLSAEQLLDALK